MLSGCVEAVILVVSAKEIYSETEVDQKKLISLGISGGSGGVG